MLGQLYFVSPENDRRMPSFVVNRDHLIRICLTQLSACCSLFCNSVSLFVLWILSFQGTFSGVLILSTSTALGLISLLLRPSCAFHRFSPLTSFSLVFNVLVFYLLSRKPFLYVSNLIFRYIYSVPCCF